MSPEVLVKLKRCDKDGAHPQLPREVTFDKNEMTVGRGEDCDIRYVDDQIVSKLHCSFAVWSCRKENVGAEDEVLRRLFVKDLSGGTFVNGRKITKEIHALNDRDVVGFRAGAGDYTVVYEERVSPTVLDSKPDGPLRSAIAPSSFPSMPTAPLPPLPSVARVAETLEAGKTGTYEAVLVKDSSFWHEESSSALLSRNDCLNAKSFREYQERVQSWPSLLNTVDSPVDTSNLSVDESALRIFTRDAERTVESSTRRKDYIEALSLVYQKVLDYHQGQGYICAFMSIFLSREDLARVVWALHTSTSHHSGYYRGEPETFVADAMVMNELARIYVPNVVRHLEKVGFVKDNTHMFCVKWFTGLGLHMMPFSVLFSFMELFLCHGREFLFRFSIHYLQSLESEILQRNNMSAVNALLRNENIEDHKKPHPVIAAWPEVDFFNHIIEKALHFNLNSAVNYAELVHREHQQYKEVMAQRRAKIASLDAAESDDEIVFSDED